MTDSELARDKLFYWSLQDRCRKVGKPIPEEWKKYGDPPKNVSDIMSLCWLANADRIQAVFDQDDMFFQKLKK